MKVKEETLKIMRFDSPDNSAALSAQLMESIDLGDHIITRIQLQPGWRWSIDMKPFQKTELDEVRHFGYMLSGKQHVVMADGSEADIGAGDLYLIPPGHDGWVVGDEPAVFLDIKHKPVYPYEEA